MVRIYRCLDDVCYRCRQPRSSKLRSHHWGRRFCVGPRFECLQTKRCALLWSVSYPCSIFHAFASRLFNASASIELQLPYRCPLVQEPEDSLSSRPFGRFPSSSAPAFSPARSLTQVPGSVRVTSANSQLSQFLQLTVFSSPFLALQLALGDSQVWSQPLNSIYAGSHRACGICQAPLLGRLTPKHLSHLPGGALLLSFPTASVVPIAFHSYLLSLARLHQGSGPGLLFSGLDLRASVWSPRLPCALFLPLHSRLGLPRGLHSSLFVHRHLHFPVSELPDTPLDGGALRSARPTQHL